ncbi:Eco57I restriction-modification methylase domain-containing protein [Haloplanus natans]|uniref:Eco57I restriction-modification methylase domain-containing protein n=1 Tax=Haloplanus natans TaxID=376171 RepID=UPI00067812BD|nr:N-6 DNA methylase [Haloplanus natans]
MPDPALPDEDSILDTEDVREVLETFVIELGDRLDTHDIERVLTGDEDNLTSADLGTRPESFTENHLIYPLLEAAGLDYEPRPFGQSGERAVWPDFELTNFEPHTIGEDKPLNNVDEAIPEVKEYLDKKSIGAEYGIATDGIEWYIFRIELGGDFTEYPEIQYVDIRPALLEVARDTGVVSSTSLTHVDVEEELDGFVSTFDRPKFQTLLSQTAPKTLRDERKRDVEAFYELYIELLFGESDEYDYETCLMDDIRSPSGATEKDERLFGITLMNRLLFIKFLESRDILYDGFLRDRVDHYERHENVLAGNLYETQIRPLFYKLLNTEVDDREPKYRRGWFDEVPYLNGGLFRENVPEESNYTVIDRILPTVISDLIEGSQLELNGGGFDPAILGSVFEKTINHIEQEREQKDTGAYYTPNDVTEIVSRNAIDPKIRDVLIETFVDIVSQDDDQATVIRGQLDEMELSEILEAVEEGRSWFATPEAIEEANDRLSQIKVLDPACGSGHFLTSAMDEVYRAQLSLQRGLSHGDTPDAETRFHLKRNLALSGIYGVDADRIATEIAKLRVWLKIVEDNSWTPEFGKLPNIDVNIIDGNSLIGLPIKGMTDVSLDFADVEEQMEEVLELRKQYKKEETEDRTEIEQLEEEIRPVLNKAYVDQLNYTVETKFEKAEEFRKFCDSIQEPQLHSKLVSIKVERVDEEELSDNDKDRLGDLGFEWQEWRDTNKSASLDVADRERELRDDDETDDPQETLVDELCELLSDGFVFSQVERRPIGDDLNDVLGTPFHWAAEFPEANSEDNGTLDVDFDIIVGNPPYGDLLSESEDALTATYRTAGEDIAALFVERQLQLLAEDGYFGNVTTLKLVYKRSMEEIQDYLRETLDRTDIACFAKRPSKVFEGAEVRIAIISGKKASSEGKGSIYTSDFIRFDNDKDRDTRFRNITYRNTDGYTLRNDGIDGDGKHVALAKVGLEHIENILQKLKEQPSLIKKREEDSETDHVIWRRRGMDYFTNPMLEKLYSGTDVKGIYFKSELEARSAFLAISSSVFYVYWCTYGDMFHLNLGEIRGFPLPEEDELESRRDEIIEISDRLWNTMEDGFNADVKNFDNYEMQKPIIEEADEVMGELYGLSEEQINFVQGYHSEYGRHGPEDSQLTDY